MLPTIERKTLLRETKVEYATHAVNPYQGCAHGCLFPCYAFNMSRRTGKTKDREDWLQPKITENAREILKRDLKRLRGKVESVHFCFMTDPFMWDAKKAETFPEIKELTLDLIRIVNEHDIPVNTLTKGITPIELASGEFHPENMYGATIVSLSVLFQQKWMPFTPHPNLTLQAIRALARRGAKTWVSIEPYPTPKVMAMPFHNDLGYILDRVSFCDKIVFGMWKYNKEIRESPHWQEYYTLCSQQVINFCEKHRIMWHIKDHTPGAPQGKRETTPKLTTLDSFLE